MRFEVDGKAGTLLLPGGRTILTSPGLKVTLTNLNKPESHVTLGITGAFHQTVRSNGDVETVSTGRSVLIDPQAGFVLAIGTFSFVFDSAGTLIQPLSGRGQSDRPLQALGLTPAERRERRWP